MGEYVKSAERSDSLSAVDIAVLARLARGSALHEVAAELHLSRRTVGRRVQDICRRLGVRNLTQAVVWAVRRDLI